MGETAAGCVRPSRPRPTQAAAPSRTAGAELWHGAGVGTTLGGRRVDGSRWDFSIFSRVFGIGFSTYGIIRWDPIMDYPISGNFDYPIKWISGNPIMGLSHSSNGKLRWDNSQMSLTELRLMLRNPLGDVRNPPWSWGRDTFRTQSCDASAFLRQPHSLSRRSP